MENPQTENGYIRIANELFDAVIATDLASRKLRCFLAIMRQTYGWNRKEATISYNEIGKSTNIKGLQHVIEAINGLVDDGIILRKKNKAGNSYEINKKYRTWKPFPKEINISRTSRKQDIPETGYPENGSRGYPENGSRGYPENGSSTDPKPLDSMRAAESLKTVKDIERHTSAKKAAGEGKESGEKINAWGTWIDVNREIGRSDPLPVGKDLKASKEIARLLKSDKAAMIRVFSAYLAEKDNFIANNGHALSLLPSRINKYLNGPAEPDDGYSLSDSQIAESIAFEEKLAAEMGVEAYEAKYMRGKK